MPQKPIDYKSTLVKLMAWCPQAVSLEHSELMDREKELVHIAWLW